jgi:hypothetical protein
MQEGQIGKLRCLIRSRTPGGLGESLVHFELVTTWAGVVGSRLKPVGGCDAIRVAFRGLVVQIWGVNPKL